MLALLGGFSLGIQNEAKLGEQPVYALALGGWRIGALLGVALCFHVWAFVVNDVTDWFTIECDQERRVHDPLGEGRIAPSRALALAAVSRDGSAVPGLPYGCGARGDRTARRRDAAERRLRVWGKRSFFPLLTDAMQAGGYACLALFAAKAVEAVFPQKMGRSAPITGCSRAPVAGWGAGYILITTLLGGLRDLAYDRACGNVRTTAMLLGAEVDPSGTISNARIVLYAFGVHVAMFALPTIVLFSSPEIGGEAAHDRVLLALYGLGAISLLVLGLAVWPHQPRRYRWIAAHQLILALPAAGAFLPFLDLNGTYVLLTAFFAPYLVQEWIVYRVLAAIHPRLRRMRSRRPAPASAGELPILQPRRAVGGVAEAAAAVGLVVLVVAREPLDVAVALEREDVGGDPVEEPAVVRDHDHAARRSSGAPPRARAACRRRDRWSARRAGGRCPRSGAASRGGGGCARRPRACRRASAGRSAEVERSDVGTRVDSRVADLHPLLAAADLLPGPSFSGSSASRD
jgi:hypothetical protein